MKKSFFILFLFCCLTKAYSFTISKPSGPNLNNCETYSLERGKHNNNTDRYDVEIYLTGTEDSNYDGIPEPVRNKKMYYQQITEDWIWGPLARRYDFIIGKKWTGTLMAVVVARRRAGGAWLEQSRTMKLYTIVSTETTPPLPKSFFYCEAGTYTLSVNPTTAGNQLKWYDNINSTYPFNTGTSYTAFFNEGLRIMYVSEVRKVGPCGFESVRMPISVYVFPKSIGVPERFAKIQPEVDNRLGEQECSRPGTYYDLEALVPISASSLGLDITAIPGVVPSFSYEVSDWKDKPYGNSINSYRVCNSHLPVGNYTKRTFYRDVNVKVTIELKNPISGETIVRNSNSCERKEFMKATVQKDNVCQADFSDARRIYNDGIVCSGSQDVSLCPNASMQIGPNTTLYNDDPSSTYSFQWSPTVGMSGSNQKNPTIGYNSISIPAGQRYVKYTCTITRKSKYFPWGIIAEEKYCVYVYLCPDCSGDADGLQKQTQPDNETLFSNILVNHDIAVYPNPASTTFTVDYAYDILGNGVLYFKNVMGVTLIEKNITTDPQSRIVDVSRVPDGIYICNVVTNDNLVLSKTVVINNSK